MIFLKRFKIFLVNGLILTATSFLMRTVGFSFNIYISKKIGAEALGIFSLIMSVYMFMITIATSGINLATTRIIVEETASNIQACTKQAMKKCLFYSFTFGIFACMLLIAFSTPICIYFLHSQISPKLLYIVAISLPFIAISSCFNGYLTALRKNGKNAGARIFEQFIKIISTSLLLSFFLPNGLEYACLSLVLGETISEIASCIFTYFLYQLETKKHVQTNLSNTNYLKEIIQISLPVAITSYIRSGLSSLKQLLIPLRLQKSGLSSNVALSSFGMIQGMVMPILLFPEVLINSFSGLVVPEFAYYDTKKEKRKITYAISRIFRITFFFSIAMIGIFYFYADSISYLVYQNFEISSYLKIFAPLLFFMYLDSIVDNILKGLNEQIGVMKCNILDLIVSIGYIYFVVPILGLNGYIFVIFVSELLNSGISLYQLKQKTHFQIDGWNWIVKPFLGIFFTYFLCQLFSSFFSLTNFSILLQLFFFVVIYFLFLLSTHCLDS